MSIFSQPITSASYQFTQWSGWTRQQQYPRCLADVNGDGNADTVGFASDGVYVALGHPDGIFSSPIFASSESPGKLGPLGTGDVNGDGRADLIEPAIGHYLSFHPVLTGIYTAYVDIANLFGETDGTFAESIRAAFNWTTTDNLPLRATAVGDVNGDRRADLVEFGDDGVYVLLANADGTFSDVGQFFPPWTLALAGLAPNVGGWTSQDEYPRALGDVNGDGRSDLVGFGASGVYVSLANADGTFAQPILALAGFAPNVGGWTSQDEYPRELGDVNGDGRVDIVGFGSYGTYIALAKADGTFGQITVDLAGFGSNIDAGGWTSQDLYPRLVSDVTGDGRADIVGFGAAEVYVAIAQPPAILPIT